MQFKRRCQYKLLEHDSLCGKPVTEGVAWYSFREYGDEYCIEHQRELKEKNRKKR